jgi:hypothetical protein
MLATVARFCARRRRWVQAAWPLVLAVGIAAVGHSIQRGIVPLPGTSVQAIGTDAWHVLRTCHRLWLRPEESPGGRISRNRCEGTRRRYHRRSSNKPQQLFTLLEEK